MRDPGRGRVYASGEAAHPQRPRHSRRDPSLCRNPVQAQALIDMLEGGRIDDFHEDFPSVTREQVLAALVVAGQALLAGACPAR